MLNRMSSAEDIGVDLFHRMFDIAPNAWDVFPWGKGDCHKEDFFANPEFLKFAKNFIGMLDLAIGKSYDKINVILTSFVGCYCCHCELIMKLDVATALQICWAQTWIWWRSSCNNLA